jgi:hypothetical protein
MTHEEIRKALADYKAALEKPISIAESRALIAQFKAVMTPYFADGLLADRDRLAAEVEMKAEELQSVLDDWNALVKATGSITNGGAVGCALALRKDAARYRWLRACKEEWSNLSVLDSRGDVIAESLDAAIDAALGGSDVGAPDA